jgi:hypothetical protein
MRKILTMICLLGLLVVLSGVTFAADWHIIIDDDFDGVALDESVWREYTNSEQAELYVDNGELWIEYVEDGWMQKGIMLREPIDITGKKTCVEVKFIETEFSAMVTVFSSNPEVEDDDTFSFTALPRVIAWMNSPGGLGSVSMDNTPPSDSSVESPGQWLEGLPLPYLMSYTITPLGGTEYSIEIVAEPDDGEAKTVSTTMDIGSINPSELYFYFHISNNLFMGGPCVVDRITVKQAPL